MTRDDFEQWLRSPRHPAQVWGILNVTADSFSDGGRFLDPAAAAVAAQQLIAEGADALDLGAESTRPGSEPVPADLQIARLLPVIKAIRRTSRILLSIDTTSAAVAAATLDQGADVINDIAAGLFDPQMLPLAAQRQAPLILMHMQGEPRTMQANPQYTNVVAEVLAFLEQRSSAALAAGVAPHRIILDPGIGFGKTTSHNLAILRHLPEFARLPYPLLVGVSRKRFIGQITGVTDPAQRVHGSTAAAAWAVTNGAAIMRVHDVAATVATVRMTQAIAEA